MNWVMAAMFILGIFFLIHSGWEWHSETGGWIKPVLRSAVMGIVGIQFVMFIFPNLSPFRFVFRSLTVMSPRDVTNPVLEETVQNGWLWLRDNYTSAGFIFSIALITVVTTLVIIGISKLKKSGKAVMGEHHPKTTAGTDPHARKANWVGIGLGTAAMLFLFALTYTAIAGFHQGHILKVEESLARQKLYQAQADAARLAKIPAPRAATPQLVQTGTTSSTATATSGNGGEVWSGLRKPDKHNITLGGTNGWSAEIPKPYGTSIRIVPSELANRVKIQTKGTGDWLDWDKAASGGKFPDDTRFVRFSLQSTPTVQATVGVGMRVL